MKRKIDCLKVQGKAKIAWAIVLLASILANLSITNGVQLNSFLEIEKNTILNDYVAWSNPNNLNDSNFSSYGYYTGVGTTGLEYENYTITDVPLTMNYTLKTQRNNGGNMNYVYCYNYPTNTFNLVSSISYSDSNVVTTTMVLPSGCLNTTIQIRNNMSAGSGLNTPPRFYESYIYGLTAENITLTASQSKTRYLLVPSGATFSFATMMLHYASIANATNGRSYWKFDENTGTLTYDDYGRSNGTLSDGNVTWVTGKIGSALNFNGAPTSSVTLNGQPNLNLTGNFSISFWVKANDHATLGSIVYKGAQYKCDIGVDGENIACCIQDTVVNNYCVAVTPLPVANQWYHVVFEKNDTHITLFLNGTINKIATWTGTHKISSEDMRFGNGTGFLNATIDEIGIWNYTLSPSDVSNLWNNGAGSRTTTPSVVNISVGGVSIGSINVENSSTTGEFTSNTTINSTTSLNDYLATCTLENGYCYLPILFSSSSNAKIRYSNLNFYNIGFFENSQTYDATAVEGSTETFKINITYDTNYYPNAIGYLIYNNTLYSSTKSGNIFTSVITAPSVSTNTAISFHWQIGLINSTGTNYFNSTTKSQTVTNLGIDNCSINNFTIINYTLRDEQTQAIINGKNQTIEVNLLIYSYLDPTSLIFNYSASFNNTSNASICFASSLLNNSKYSLYSQAKYFADGYVTRYNYIQNYTLTNSSMSQKVTLFDLLETEATKFLLTYTGSTFLAVSGAVISINRQYLAENVYKTVESELTDDAGQAIGYMDETAKYQVIVTKNGQILTTFNSVTPYCASTSLGCSINLNEAAPYATSVDFETYLNLDYSESFNTTTGLYTLIFATKDNSIVTMNTTLIKWDNYNNKTLCSNQVTTSSGTLTCQVSSMENQTIVAKVYKDGIEIFNSYWAIEATNTTYAGNYILLFFGLVLSVGVMLVPSTIGLIIGAIIGLAIGSYLFLVKGMYLSSGILILLVISGGIIIWRLRQGGND